MVIAAWLWPWPWPWLWPTNARVSRLDPDPDPDPDPEVEAEVEVDASSLNSRTAGGAEAGRGGASLPKTGECRRAAGTRILVESPSALCATPWPRAWAGNWC